MSNKSFNPNRVPGGIPQGGEFANKRTDESDIALTMPNSTSEQPVVVFEVEGDEYVNTLVDGQPVGTQGVRRAYELAYTLEEVASGYEVVEDFEGGLHSSYITDDGSQSGKKVILIGGDAVNVIVDGKVAGYAEYATDLMYVLNDVDGEHFVAPDDELDMDEYGGPLLW